jgi:hypothetical protein
MGRERVMRSEAAQPSSSRRRLGAAAVATVCLVAQLAIVTHAALVEHVRCPIHGDLIHPGESHEHHDLHAAHAPKAAPVDDRDAAAPLDERDAEEHEHCIVLGHRREAAPGIAPLDGETRESEWLAPPAPASVPRASPIARYRIAPKNSPPLA